MSVNWKKLASKIPERIQIKRNRYYKIIWVDSFNDKALVGLMDMNKRCIFIKKKQSSKQKVLTYLHECLHAFSDENDVKLTEKQVLLLEQNVLYYMLKPSNLFTKDKK